VGLAAFLEAITFLIIQINGFQTVESLPLWGAAKFLGGTRSANKNKKIKQPFNSMTGNFILYFGYS
jgi:hypothetical protein